MAPWDNLNVVRGISQRRPVVEWKSGFRSPAETRTVYVLPAVGSINPGLAEFIVNGIQEAERQRAEAW